MCFFVFGFCNTLYQHQRETVQARSSQFATLQHDMMAFSSLSRPLTLSQPPSKYTMEEFRNNVLPRASENQPPRILNELRQLSCRLVASGIAKGLLTEADLPQIRETLVGRFQVCSGISHEGSSRFEGAKRRRASVS